MTKNIDSAVYDLINACKQALRVLRYYKTTKPSKLEKDLKEEALSIVSKWYATYEPMKYRRTMSLKRAFKITRNGIDIKIDYDPSLISGHRDNTAVFYNSFEQGYHGGAIGTDKAGFSVSVPSWRSPYGYYIHWGDPAPKSFSPKDEIEKKSQKLMNQYEKEWLKILWEDIFPPIEKKFNNLIAMLC